MTRTARVEPISREQEDAIIVSGWRVVDVTEPDAPKKYPSTQPSRKRSKRHAALKPKPHMNLVQRLTIPRIMMRLTQMPVSTSHNKIISISGQEAS